jgi:hypothetical protein
VFAEEVLSQPREVRQQARVLEHPAAERIDDGDTTDAGHLDQARHAEPGVCAELERVAEPRIGPPQDHVDALELAERAHPDPALTHRQVCTLHQRVPQMGSQIGVLEGGLAPRAGT